MPTQIILKNKEVSLNNKNTAIINILIALKLTENELSPSLEKEKKGLSQNLIRFIEKMTDHKLGGSTIELATCKVDLDPPALALRESYIDFLNNLATEDEISATDMEKTQITSALVLVREILIRFITIALSSDIERHGQDGIKIIGLLTEFCNQLRKNIQLLEKGIIFTETSELGKALSTNHHTQWIKILTEMVEAIKLIHANTGAISNTIHWLTYTRLCLTRHIVVELNINIHPDELEENQIRGALEKCENSALTCQDNHIMSSSKELITARNDNGSRQLAILNSLPEKKPSIFGQNITARNRIKQLYEFLSETNLLYQAISNLDLMNTMTGWIFLLTGAIKLEALADRIKEHNIICSNILSIKNDSPIFKKKHLAKKLTALGALDSSLLEIIAAKAFKSLIELGNPEVLLKLANYIKQNLSLLTQLEPILKIQIVDKTILHDMGFSMPIIPLISLEKNSVVSVQQENSYEKILPVLDTPENQTPNSFLRKRHSTHIKSQIIDEEIILDQNITEEKQSIIIENLNNKLNIDINRLTKYYVNDSNISDLSKITAKEIKNYLNTIALNIFSKKELRIEIISSLIIALEKSVSNDNDDELIICYLEAKKLLANATAMANINLQHEICMSHLHSMICKILDNISYKHIETNSYINFIENKLDAVIIHAAKDDDCDTMLMQLAVKDIRTYLTTITTNILSNRKQRQKLIEQLDQALGQARQEQHDESLIRTYRDIENELQNTPSLQRINSHLHAIVKITNSIVLESSTYGDSHITNSKDDKTLLRIKLVRKNDKELTDIKEQVKQLKHAESRINDEFEKRQSDLVNEMERKMATLFLQYTQNQSPSSSPLTIPMNSFNYKYSTLSSFSKSYKATQKGSPTKTSERLKDNHEAEIYFP